MCKVIAICNQKGGVSKTTTTVNLGVGLVREGKKVLVIDADPQGNLSQSLGIENPDELEIALPSIMEQIIMDKDVDVTKGIIHHEEGVDLMPCNIDLSGVDVSLVNAMSREFVLKTYVESMRDFYDYILIDCPPSLGMITINALSAADQLYVPIQSEYYALEGVEQLMQTVTLVKQNFNPTLFVGGIIITMYDGRMRLSRDVVDTVKDAFGDVVFKTMIPRNVRLAEAPSYGRAIIDYEAISKGAKAYNDLAKEVIKRG